MGYELKERALQPSTVKETTVTESEKREIVAAFEERLSKEGFTGLTVSDVERLWDVCEDYFYTSKGGNGLPPVTAVTTRTDNDVKVEVCQMVTMRYKSGREKREYGVKFYVDGKEFPLHFHLKTATMIYVCTLLRHKMGERMFGHDFYRVPCGRRHCGASQEWLKSVYDMLFPAKSKDYRDWERSLRNVSWSSQLGREVCREGAAWGHNLANGVSRVRSEIKKTLNGCMNALDLCSVSSDKDECGMSFYGLKIAPENIIIPKEFEGLLTPCANGG